MDILEVTYKQTVSEPIAPIEDENIVMLDMCDVCCEIDVGDVMTTSKDEPNIDIGPLGVDSTIKYSPCSTKCESQVTGNVRCFAKRRSKVEELDWMNYTDPDDLYEDSDNDSQDMCLCCTIRAEKHTSNHSTQTDKKIAVFSIVDFKDRPDAVYFYTGLESYNQLMSVFKSLAPACYELNCDILDILDQFFLTLIKLRTNKDIFELSVLFGISEQTVMSIFKTWISFMHKMWTQLDFWPSNSVAISHCLSKFKDQFQSVRVIVNCLEIPISISDDGAQPAALYPSRSVHSVKVLVGITPVGSICFCSKAYGGGTSDDEVFELSGILDKLQPGDSVILDERFHVEKICSRKEIATHATNLKSFAGLTSRTDISKTDFYPFKSVEQMLEKNQIVSQKLSDCWLSLASEICYVCIMIGNFLGVENAADGI